MIGKILSSSAAAVISMSLTRPNCEDSVMRGWSMGVGLGVSWMWWLWDSDGEELRSGFGLLVAMGCIYIVESRKGIWIRT